MRVPVLRNFAVDGFVGQAEDKDVVFVEISCVHVSLLQNRKMVNKTTGAGLTFDIIFVWPILKRRTDELQTSFQFVWPVDVPFLRHAIMLGGLFASQDQSNVRQEFSY